MKRIVVMCASLRSPADPLDAGFTAQRGLSKGGSGSSSLGPSFCSYSPTSHKDNFANFACTEFSEVRLNAHFKSWLHPKFIRNSLRIANRGCGNLEGGETPPQAETSIITR
jgi:hypothetical protein